METITVIDLVELMFMTLAVLSLVFAIYIGRLSEFAQAKEIRAGCVNAISSKLPDLRKSRYPIE